MDDITEKDTRLCVIGIQEHAKSLNPGDALKFLDACALYRHECNRDLQLIEEAEKICRAKQPKAAPIQPSLELDI